MNQHRERLDGLHPMLYQPVVTLLAQCELQLTRTLLLVYGWRSVQEQLLLYQQGRTWEAGTWVVTDQAAVVTNAPPGTTAHNVITAKGAAASMAVDVIPLNEDGTADWDVDDAFWAQLYSLAWKVGLDPLGDVTGAYLKRDKGHFEEPGWRGKLSGLACQLPASDDGTRRET